MGRSRRSHGKRPVAKSSLTSKGPFKVTFHPGAIEDARAARRWYAEADVALGVDFVRQLDLAIGLISKQPNAWPRHPFGVHRYFMHRFPFAVVYRSRKSEVEIVAMTHGKRRPNFWKRRG
jgi:toxin ParE1/3/4